MTKNNQQKIAIKLAILGSGDFAKIIHQTLKNYFYFNTKKPDLIIVANYGRKITPQELSKYRFINIHGSLLPALKGSSPIQTAILQGLDTTGYTIIEMDEKIDHGKIIAQEAVKIKDDDTFGSLSNKIAHQSAKKLIKIIPDYLKGIIKPYPQPNKGTSWTKKIYSHDRIISHTLIKKNPKQAERIVRALYPKPKAYILLNKKQLIIHQAEIKNDKFIPRIVQLEGKKPLTWEKFLQGWRKPLPNYLL